MTKNFVEELRWRGMLAQIMPGTEEYLNANMVSAYLGTDPTADSLHIGHLCGIMMLRHLQRCGHKPYLLVGGATGMIGDPSGKSQERNLLDAATLYHNQEAIKKQVSKFLDFDGTEPNKAELVNNYDWMKDFTFLDFAREVGKHITVYYMMAKDSVQKRLNGEARDGLSFTEFTYQLLQGYDFLYQYQKYGVRLQLGGNDQWGNMTTGTELIHRTLGNDAECYCLTCPLITKSDGKKFGKTESGNVWLDPARTTPYAFYQFWLNVSDAEAEKYIKIFTDLDKETIDALIAEHNEDPGRRTLQKRLAEEVTQWYTHARTSKWLRRLQASSSAREPRRHCRSLTRLHCSLSSRVCPTSHCQPTSSDSPQSTSSHAMMSRCSTQRARCASSFRVVAYRSTRRSLQPSTVWLQPKISSTASIFSYSAARRIIISLQ